MAHPVVHFEVMGKDGKALQGFYSELFGWKVDTNNPMDYGLVDTGGNGNSIPGGVATNPDGSNYLTFYVESDDLQGSLDKAESLGGKTVTAPMDLPMGISIALFSDPEGNLVGLVTPRPEGQ